MGTKCSFQVKNCTDLLGDNTAGCLLKSVLNPDFSINDIFFHILYLSREKHCSNKCEKFKIVYKNMVI